MRGTHVNATGQIGYFKIISESAIAAGIRRIEAITGNKAQEFLTNQALVLAQLKDLLKNPKDIIKSVESLINDKNTLEKKIGEYNRQKLDKTRQKLLSKINKIGDINLIAGVV